MVRTAVNAAKANARLAQDKIIKNDSAGARSLLVGAIASLEPIQDGKAVSQQKSLFALLDSVDHPQDISPTLVWQPDTGSDPVGLLAVASGSTLFAYWPGRLG